MTFASLFNFVKEKFLYFDGIFNKLVMAVVIFLIGLIIGRLVGNFIKRILNELEINKVVKKTTAVDIHIEENAGDVLSYIIYFFAAILALESIGLAKTILNIIAGGVMLLIIIAVILGIKDYVPNFISGIIIYKNKLIKKGDYIDVADVKGEVVNVRLIETEIKNGSDSIYIPNSTILKNRLRIKKK